MKKKIIVIVCIILAFIAGILIGTYVLSNEKEEKINNVDIKYNKGEKYYIITGDYKGEYDYQELDLSDGFEGNEEETNDRVKLFNTTEIFDYNQYYEFCEKWNLKMKYKDDDKNYMVISYASIGQPIVRARIANIVEENNKVTVYLWENIDGVTADIGAYFIVIPVSEKTYKKEVNVTYTKNQYKNIVKYGYTQNPDEILVKKPIIYIYPEEEMKVNVVLKNSSLLTTSYPKYNDGWTVIAKPNGTLKELNSSREYYGLYYEGNDNNVTMQKDGFVVKGEDTINFLEEKLKLLGLNERESNEFIIYWLPQLENNKYNYIRFETKEEIENYMPLEISPEPDTVIRVIMNYKPLNKKIKVQEQELTPQTRSGYTVVEWGGSKLK